MRFKNSKNSKILLGLEELNNLSKHSEELELSKICVFTSSLARGQNYYTGNVFEVFDNPEKITSSIGTG